MGRLLAMVATVNALDVLIAGIAMAHGAEKIVSRNEDLLRIRKVAAIDVPVY